MIGRSLNADLLKMKGTSVILAHLLIPIITSVIFLIYYFFSPWNENMKVIAFYQAIGAGLPVPVSYTHLDVYKRQVQGRVHGDTRDEKAHSVVYGRISAFIKAARGSEHGGELRTA